MRITITSRPYLKFATWLFGAALFTVFFTATFAVSSADAQLFGTPGATNPDLEIVKDFDADKDGVLNSAERKKARASLEKNSNQRRGRGGPGGRRGPRRRGGGIPKGKPGDKVSPSDVKIDTKSKFYDTKVLRTIFLKFEQDDWEQELADFKPTDVEIPAEMIVDGKTYPNVGVSFRGASSFLMIPEGSKRSLNISMDYLDDKQKLYGYKSLNLLNGNGDPTMMSSVLYSTIARKRMATAKVNFVKVVINGRNWGIYTNSQQFNKTFLNENYGTKKGNRWKVGGNPIADAGLRYMGDRVASYREKYELKSKENDKAWADLINLCKVIERTPADKLESALSPILDIEGVLWFLACDIAFINSDGYWTRASDYNIYQNTDGKFFIIPHDMNESFREPHKLDRSGGPPGSAMLKQIFGPRPGAGGDTAQGNASQKRYTLDPLVGLTETRFPLRSKLLKNPKFKTLYLQYLREIARESLNWEQLSPKIESWKALIADEVKADSRKLMPNKAFEDATDLNDTLRPESLREFVELRAKFLLDHAEIKQLPEDLVTLDFANQE